MKRLILHEYHISNFHAPNKVLNGWTEITTARPNILHKSNFFLVDAKGLSEPPEVELDTLILEKLVVVAIVEHLDAEHDEAGVVSASDADVVQVVESHAELRADQWVGRGVQLTGHAVGLEAVDAC